MSSETVVRALKSARQAVVDREDEIEGLDRAIGDGDHYHNVRRGIEALFETIPELEATESDKALRAIAMKLLSTVGGAAGPLFSSFFLAMSRTEGAAGDWDREAVARMFRAGVDGVQARGKAGLGDKTMLDVLIPVAETLESSVAEEIPTPELVERVKAVAGDGVRSTRDIAARFGRAAFLGERAVGHVDPGAMTCYVIVSAVCDAVAPSSE